MRRLIRISVGLVTTAVVGFVLLLVASIHSFFALTDETLIAELEFARAGEHQKGSRLTGLVLEFHMAAPIKIIGRNVGGALPTGPGRKADADGTDGRRAGAKAGKGFQHFFAR